MAASSRHVIVTGRVQGVAFRWATREKAVELGLRGWVRNHMDGSVEARIEGPEEHVETMLAWLHEGPRAARVHGVEVHAAEPEGTTEFEIRSTAY